MSNFLSLFFAFCLVGLLCSCKKTDLQASCEFSCAVADTINHQRKVLLIGIDGLRGDALQEANTPNLDNLRLSGRHHYQMDRGIHTLSGPGWSNMLTGVWHNKHGVTDNSYQGRNYGQYPHFFCRLQEQNPCYRLGSIVHYGALNDYMASACGASVLLEFGTDIKVKESAANHLADCDLDVLFVNFNDVDFCGHAFGFHPTEPNYIKAIETTDKHVGDLVAAIKGRSTYAQEDWLIVMGTDHGGKKNGTHGGHDGDDEVQKIPVIFSNAGFAAGELSTAPNIVDMAPTIFDFMQVPIDSVWDWDGQILDL